MALTHEIKNQAGSITFDFTDGENALMIKDTGWRIQGIKGDKVIETMTLFGESANAANVIDAVNDLNKLGRMARQWLDDDRNSDAIWYYRYGESETPKRSLVYDITIQSFPNGLSNPTLDVGEALYSFSITHSAIWEDTSAQTFAEQTVSSIGGQVNLAEIAGDEDARFERFSAYGNSGTIMAAGMKRLWWGMKYGSPTGFSALQEVEDATINSACTPLPTTQADTDASDSVKVEWLTSATFQRICGDVLQLWFSDFPTGYTGRYLVLLRCKVSAANPVRLQLRYGAAGGEVSLGDHYIQNTSYEFVEMGEINIPPGIWRTAAATFGAGKNSAAMYIWGQHMVSQVTLSLDCLVLIPLQAHGYADNAQVGYLFSGWEHGSNFYHTENDEMSAISYSKNGAALAGIFGAVQYNGETWRYLRDGGVLVIAGQRDGVQNKNDIMKIAGTYFRRYRTHAESV